MRRSLLLGLLCLVTAWSLSAKAQTLYGLKGGVNMPRLYYSNPYLSDLPHDFLLGPSRGVFVEFPIANRITLAPELNYQYRGGATSYRYQNQYDVSYQLQADYLNLRVPVCYYLSSEQSFKPYLLAGPDIGCAVKGAVKLKQTGLPIDSIPLNRSNIQRFYLGALAGAGIRLDINVSKILLVLKLDAAINWGFTDTFSPDEHHETAHATNINAYNHQGLRFSRGLEAHLSLGCVFKGGMKDACGNFQSGYKRKKVSYVW